MEFADLGEHQYIALETFRMSGAGVVTPVWVAGDGDRLYVITDGTSWKVKRIRNTARVRVAASDSRGNPKGAWLDGRARVMAAAEAADPERRLAAKYGIQYRLFALMNRLRGRGSDRVVLELVSAQQKDAA